MLRSLANDHCVTQIAVSLFLAVTVWWSGEG